MMRYVFVLLLFISFGEPTRASEAIDSEATERTERAVSWEELSCAIDTALCGARDIGNTLGLMLPLAAMSNSTIWGNDVLENADTRFQLDIHLISASACVTYRDDDLINGNGFPYRAKKENNPEDWMCIDFSCIDVSPATLGLTSCDLTSQTNAATAYDVIRMAISTVQSAIATLSANKHYLNSSRNFTRRLQGVSDLAVESTSSPTWAGDDIFGLDLSVDINVQKALVCNCKHFTAAVTTALMSSRKVAAFLALNLKLVRDQKDKDERDIQYAALDIQYQRYLNGIDSIVSTRFCNFELINGSGPAYCIAQVGLDSRNTFSIDFSHIDLGVKALDLQSTDLMTKGSMDEARTKLLSAIQVTDYTIAHLTATRKVLEIMTSLNEELQDAFSAKRRA